MQQTHIDSSVVQAEVNGGSHAQHLQPSQNCWKSYTASLSHQQFGKGGEWIDYVNFC